MNRLREAGVPSTTENAFLGARRNASMRMGLAIVRRIVRKTGTRRRQVPEDDVRQCRPSEAWYKGATLRG